MNIRNLLTVSSLCLLISACGNRYITEPPTPRSSPPQLSEAPPPLSDPPPLQPTRPTIEPTAALPPPLPPQRLPAAVALRDQAKVATTANDHSRAIGLLERALRISPDDPQIFYDLANNHLALDQPQEALQLAMRGLTLNPTDTQRTNLQELVNRSQANL